MVVRLTAAVGALGVGRVLMSTDTFGVPRVVRASSARTTGPCVEDPLIRPSGKGRVDLGCS
jgi:hypothetical protein